MVDLDIGSKRLELDSSTVAVLDTLAVLPACSSFSTTATVESIASTTSTSVAFTTDVLAFVVAVESWCDSASDFQSLVSIPLVVAYSCSSCRLD
jgi:hypothetical protein